MSKGDYQKLVIYLKCKNSAAG